MSKCPNCGGELTFNVKGGKIKCDYCKSTFDPKKLKIKMKASKEREQFSGKSYNCSQCGATLLTFDETAITFCSYCGSQSMIESKMIKVNNPDLVIPFKKDKEECVENYKKLLKKSKFVPDYMKSDLVVEKFRGIFIPYCVYKASIHSNTSNIGSVYSHRSGDYVIYNDYNITARVDADYDGISYDLLSKFYDSYSTSIPFDFKEAIEFDKNYLIGFYADTKDVEENVYDKEAENLATKDATIRLKKEKTFSKYGCSNPKACLKVSERKTGMFPLYFLAIRTKDNKYVHYAVINGQTGEIAADLPIDFKKYIIYTIILSVIIFVLLQFVGTITPNKLLVFSLFASLVSIIISNNQLSKINRKNNRLDDLGFVTKEISDKNKEKVDNEEDKEKTKDSKSKGENKDSQEKEEDEEKIKAAKDAELKLELKKKTKDSKNSEKKFKYLYKQLIAIALALIVLLQKPVDDIYYYIAALIGLIITLISFSDLVKEHNMLTSNKLPQLEERGGDKNE